MLKNEYLLKWETISLDRLLSILSPNLQHVVLSTLSNNLQKCFRWVEDANLMQFTKRMKNYLTNFEVW